MPSATTNILTIVANFGLKNHLIISERNDPEFQTISNIWSLLRNIFYRMELSDKETRILSSVFASLGKKR